MREGEASLFEERKLDRVNRFCKSVSFRPLFPSVQKMLTLAGQCDFQWVPRRLEAVMKRVN